MTSSIPTLGTQWIFSQSPPLSTSDLTSEARKRGLELDAPILRELCRRGDLVPIVEITTEPAQAPAKVLTGPDPRGSLLADLWVALSTGRVRDLAMEPHRPRTRFDSRRPTDPRGWSNGLIYSRWQLLGVSYLRQRLMQARVRDTGNQRRIHLPELNERSRKAVAEQRRWALVLTALEARYLPVIEPETLHLTNAELAQWESYVETHDPVESARSLGITGQEVRDQAERLLGTARRLDPTGDWSVLIRRAPRRAWRTLTGDLLLSLEHRLAAEILLLFHEDLAARDGSVMPIEAPGGFIWHPLHERISARRSEPLDVVLARLGISPHPGVVLVVEGETEELLVPRVFDHLGLRRTPDMVTILCMRGADKQLPLVAAATVAPLLGERHDDTYDMIRPPSRLVIAVDQDDQWDTEMKVASQRRLIIQEIEKVVAAQGATLSTEDLDTLVLIRRWPGRCFEFAHFNDDELATAMQEIHPNCGGLTRKALVDRISIVRASNHDIKKVWDHRWIPKPKKPALAEVLWPVLQGKIDAAASDHELDVPSVAEVVHEAYELAYESNYGIYAVRISETI